MFATEGTHDVQDQKRTLVGVQCLGEVVDRGRHLQAALQDRALALETHVAGPLDKAGQVALRGHVPADAEVALVRREQVRVLGVERNLGLLLATGGLGSGLGRGLGGGGRGLGSSNFGLEVNIEPTEQQESQQPGLKTPTQPGPSAGGQGLH